MKIELAIIMLEIVEAFENVSKIELAMSGDSGNNNYE